MFLLIVKLIHNICLFVCCNVVINDPGLSTHTLNFGLYYVIMCHMMEKKIYVLNLNASYKTNSKNYIHAMVFETRQKPIGESPKP
jgi:hypothetical protein